MARAKSAKADEALRLFQSGVSLIEISERIGVPPGTVRRWKHDYGWKTERERRSESNANAKAKANVRKKPGAPFGNQNAKGNHGGPPKGSQNALKYGFFAKYLPEETKEIFDEIEQSDPLDLLWHNIQIAYAAILRAQRIAYVKDQQDKTIERIEERDGATIGEKWEVQEAWDKQAAFMKAQARAQDSLAKMIKQYDEMLHKRWDLATEEQKARIQLLQMKAQLDEAPNTDDGFIEALSAAAESDWNEDSGV